MKLKSQYICNVYKCWKRKIELDSYVYLLMDYYCDRSLDYYIKQNKKENKIILQTIIIKYIEEISYGIKEIHEKKYIHRDIKPQNILLNNLKISITDFGVSKLHDKTSITPGIGTYQYFAPEQLDEDYTSSVGNWYNIISIINKN